MRSVATTSTKSPPIIKSDIKRVLERMRVQYRETKGGYDCIHLPSIDLNALTEAQAQRYQQHHSEGTTKRSIVRKASKLTFSSAKGKEKEHEVVAATEKDREKEAPSRPSATASSGSSSFFNMPASVATAQPHVPSERPSSAAGGGEWSSPSPPQAESSNPSLLPNDDHRPKSPSKPKFLPPIPRDFASPPTKETSGPTLSETDKDPFDPANQNGLAVRFEINIVKVGIPLLGSSIEHDWLTCPHV